LWGFTISCGGGAGGTQREPTNHDERCIFLTLEFKKEDCPIPEKGKVVSTCEDAAWTRKKTAISYSEVIVESQL
jgi:hypothetical protein